MYMRYHYDLKSHIKQSDCKLNVNHTRTPSLPSLLPQQLSPVKEKSPQLSKMGNKYLSNGVFPDVAYTSRKGNYTEHIKTEKGLRINLKIIYIIQTLRDQDVKRMITCKMNLIQKSVHFNNVVTVKDIDGQVSQKEIKLISRNKKRQRTKLENLAVIS